MAKMRHFVKFVADRSDIPMEQFDSIPETWNWVSKKVKLVNAAIITSISKSVKQQHTCIDQHKSGKLYTGFKPLLLIKKNITIIISREKL